MTNRDKTCQAQNCDHPAEIKGYCWKHYQQIRRHGRLTPEREHGKTFAFPELDPKKYTPWTKRTGCIVEGCKEKHQARGYCKRHYAQWWYAQRKRGDSTGTS